MSQKKVEQYKQYKGNRKEILKKQKRKSLLITISLAVVGVAIVALIIYMLYSSAVANKAGTDANNVNLESINGYTETLDMDIAMSTSEEEAVTDDAAELTEDTIEATE